jgi:unsaturated chondroitin disaccharide hydrolase
MDGAIAFAQKQILRLAESQPDFYPMYTKEGLWNHDGPLYSNWCDGFFPGVMWILNRYEAARGRDASRWQDLAIKYSKPLEERQFDREVTDLGFLFFSTYHRWYQLTGDKACKAVLVQAGRTLATRFKEKGQYLSSPVGDESLFIDMMMNVGLIFYAAKETGDRTLREIAIRHSLTTRKVLVRGDGSTAHEGIFDVANGQFVRQATQQGARADSCWARGLSWGLYGFTTCYEYSRDPNFLRTAEACADYYITHTGANGVPPWDFNAPSDSRKQVDTSAAAIAASGFLRLCRMVPDHVKGHFYWTTGVRILRTLCEDYLGDGDPDWEGILKGGVYHNNKGIGVNESVIWGDYFFVEALEQALRKL